MVKLRRVFESDLYLESKKDLDDLKAYLGDKLYDDYMKIRDKIPKDQNDYKDFDKLKKKDKKDIQSFVSSFQSKSDKKKSDKTEGAEKLYEDSDWVVYRITSYPAAQLYGKGTKWCITGRYPGHEGRGEEYFNEYIEDNSLDGGYYFYLNKKNPSEKYCVLQYDDNTIHSIWNAEDTDMGSSLEDINVGLPTVKGVNIPKINPRYLYNAIVDGKYSLVKEYLEKGIGDINYKNYRFNFNTPLSYAIKVIPLNMDIVECLLKNGADPNITDGADRSLLGTAVAKDKDLVSLLLSYGADPNVPFDPNDDSTYPLSMAYYREDEDIMDMLLKNGANPNINGYTSTEIKVPLLLSAASKKSPFLKLLLKYKANPDIKNDKGETPLFRPVLKSMYDNVELLLKAGADPNIKISGDSYLDLAKENNDDKMVSLLKKYGAKE